MRITQEAAVGGGLRMFPGDPACPQPQEGPQGPTRRDFRMNGRKGEDSRCVSSSERKQEVLQLE